MPVSSKKIYYHTSAGETRSVDLYDQPGDAGSNYIAIRDVTSALYMALGQPTDPNASQLRVYKGGVIWAVLASQGTPGTSFSSYIEGGMFDSADAGMFPVTVSSDNLSFGSVFPHTMDVLDGDDIIITATPIGGHTFSQWTITEFGSPTYTDTNNPLTLTITVPTIVIATFV